MDYFDYSSENGEDGWGFNLDEFLEHSHEAEKQRLENELQRIDTLLEQRETVHTETIDELESKLDWYLDRLRKLYKRHSLKEEREEVKKQIRRFYQEIRKEKRAHWLDRQELEQERRQLLQELDELELDDLFEDLI